MPSVASVVAVSIGLIVLVGWAFNADRLTRFDPNFVAMNPATAVLIVASGIAVALRLSRGASRATVVVAKILAVAVASLAMAQLFEMTGLWDSPVDEVLFPDRLWDARHQIMNRMAPNSALSLVMVGLSILTIDPSGRRLISQTLAILVGFIAVISIIGYTYGVQSLTGVGTFIPMTLPAAITFLFLAGGLLFAVPHAPLIEPFATDDPRGVLARRLFPLAIFLILFLGWVCVWGVRHGVFDNTFGTALYAISLSIFFVILIRWTVATVGKLEMERAEMTARLHDLNRRKDEMIAVVSHDLCSPLTGFRMVIDLLREKHQQPTDELLGLMDKSARRMVSMVRGLLDISKLQAEKVELELEDVL
ncbi:MAG: sensor histidine kinase, partial [Chthoniobacterales bacterium]